MTAREAPKKDWSRVPDCPWRVAEATGGGARCSYAPLRGLTAALRMAEFTLFDQRYVEDAMRGLRENYHGPFERSCTPADCPRLIRRLADRIRS